MKTESEIQGEIVDALRALGFAVYITSNAAKLRPKGAVQSAIPDLLIANPDYEFNLIGLEIKKPKGSKTSEAQQAALDKRHYAKATCVEDALFRVLDALKPDSVQAMKCWAYLGEKPHYDDMVVG